MNKLLIILSIFGFFLLTETEIRRSRIDENRWIIYQDGIRSGYITPNRLNPNEFQIFDKDGERKQRLYKRWDETIEKEDVE